MIALISQRLRSWLTGNKPVEQPVPQPVVRRVWPVAPQQAAAPQKQTSPLQKQPTPPSQPTAQSHKPAAQARRKSPTAPPAPAVQTTSKKDRPAVDALSRAVELVSANAQVTSAEVAKSLGVSASYARSLLRRAKTRIVEQKPTLVAVPPSAPVESRPVESIEDNDGLDAILARLSAAEAEISHLRTRPVAKDLRWDLNTRGEVLRRYTAGEAPEVIAAALAIPRGQVRFILDINHILLAR